jgi:hypothetical protein
MNGLIFFKWEREIIKQEYNGDKQLFLLECDLL